MSHTNHDNGSPLSPQDEAIASALAEGRPHDSARAAAAADDAEHSHVPIKYARKTGAYVALGAAVIAVGLAAAFFFGTHRRDRDAADLRRAAEESADAPIPVNVMHVEPAPADNLLVLPGDARAFAETTIFARTSGYLSEWKVDIGDRVKAGQELATIDNPELDDQLAAAKAKVEALKSDVRVAQTNADFAKVSADRWASAAPDGVVSVQERDQKNSEYASSLAKVKSAEAQVKLGEADVQRLTTLSKFKSVVAPYAGTITQRHVDVGALVTAGSTTNTSSLFTIAQFDQIRIFVDVPQPAVADVKIGMPVTARVAEYPDHVFAGKVDRTADAIDPASKMLRVQVLVPNPDRLLLPGMYAEVTFKSVRAKPPLRIPAAALCLRPTGPKVAVVGDDGQVAFRDIKIGRDTGEFIEVTSGLNGNETVALNIGNDVVDGSHIDAKRIPSAAEAPAAKPVLPAAPAHASAPAAVTATLTVAPETATQPPRQ
jgi:RND family efflux transporter MFP subunit